MGVPFLQNRPPGAVAALNNVYSRAAAAIEEKLYRYKGLGLGRYCVTNTKNGHRYTFALSKANCSCVDSVTNVCLFPCIHSIVLILRLNLKWRHFDLSVRRNIRNSLLKTSDAMWTILGSPKSSEDRVMEQIWEDSGILASGYEQELESDAGDNKEELADSYDFGMDSLSDNQMLILWVCLRYRLEQRSRDYQPEKARFDL